MIVTKFIVLYIGLFLTVIFAALAIKLYRMPKHKYNQLQRHILTKSLYVNIKNNKWELF